MDISQSLNLYNRIIDRLNYEKKLQRIRKRIYYYSGSLLLLLAIFVPIIKIFFNEINQSGFIQFASLLFTDFKLILDNYTDFAWSIIESIPATSFALTLLIATLFLFISKRLIISFYEFKSLLKTRLITN